MLINYAYIFSLVGLPPMMPNATRTGSGGAPRRRGAWQFNAMTARWYFTLPLSGALILFQFGAGCAAQVFAYRALTEDEASAPVAGGGLPD